MSDELFTWAEARRLIDEFRGARRDEDAQHEHERRLSLVRALSDVGYLRMTEEVRLGHFSFAVLYLRSFRRAERTDALLPGAEALEGFWNDMLGQAVQSPEGDPARLNRGRNRDAYARAADKLRAGWAAARVPGDG